MKTDEKKLSQIIDVIPDKVREELDTFSENTVTAYIWSWYSSLFPGSTKEDDFILECRGSLNHILNKLYVSIIAKDPVVCLDTVVESSSDILVTILDDLRIAYKGRDITSRNDTIGLRTFAMQYPEAILSRILEPVEARNGFSSHSSDLLKAYAWQGDLQCRPLESFLKQLLTITIFEASLKKFSNRDTINTLLLSAFSTSTQEDTQSTPAVVCQSDPTRMPAFQSVGRISSELATPRPQQPAQQPMKARLDMGGSDAVSLETGIRKGRGRRLSFRTKSTSSIADFEPEDDAETLDKKRSFLQRTSFLLSRSRSRSASPSKEGAFQGRHNRSRSVSPFKKSPMKADSTAIKSSIPSLFQAELIVSDCSDVATPMWNEIISQGILPRFSILISPISQKGSGFSHSAAGVGIFRSILDVQHLHERFKIKAKNEEMSSFEIQYDLAAWPQMTHAALERRVAMYLTGITRVEALADSNEFRQFCRSDLVSQDSAEQIGHAVSGGVEQFRAEPEDVRAASEHQREAKKNLPADSIWADGEVNATPAVASIASGNPDDSGPLAASALELADTTNELKDILTSTSPGDQSSTSGIDLSRIDVTNLVSQSIELLTAFYALSPRTWTIRRQLLQLLRTLILSRSSTYTKSFVDWLEFSIFRPISDPETVAALIARCNDYLFAERYDTGASLSSEESAALASSARKVFLDSAISRPIRNLMGAGPTIESLSILFDALQDPEFSYGLFSLLASAAANHLITLD